MGRLDGWQLTATRGAADEVARVKMPGRLWHSGPAGLKLRMAQIKPLTLAADLPLKAQTRLVRWMVHVIQDDRKVAEAGMTDGIDGRIVTFNGRAGEAQLKAIIKDKDVVLYRWKRGLDLELRTALAQYRLTQKCGVLTSDASVIAEIDKANLGAAENADGEPISIFDVTLGRLSEAEELKARDR